jgi:Cu-processing system permease protein
LIGASVLLGASFLAMGYLISSLVRERATAAGIAVGVWLFFVVIYDMALLGVLAADQGRHVSPGLLNALLLLNPSDVYRLLNLTGFENISLYAGMAGVSDQASLPLAALVAALLLWIAVPFLLATAAFRNKPL